MKRASLMAIMTVLMISTLYAFQCTYFAKQITCVVCTDNAGCNTYSLPLANACNDQGSATGQTFGNIQTNSVTVTTYTSGSCTNLCCANGMVFSVQTNQVVESFCKKCS